MRSTVLWFLTAALAAVAMGAPSLQLLSPPPILINQQLEFAWNTERNATWWDGVYITPHNASAWVDCGVNLTDCFELYGDWVQEIIEESEMYSSGTAFVESLAPYPIEYDAWLVMCEYNGNDYECAAVDRVLFEATSPNTLELISGDPAHLGVLFAYTAPPLHGSSDYVKLLNLDCTPDEDNNFCAVAWIDVPEAASGTVALEVPDGFVGKQLAAVYDVCDIFRTNISAAFTVAQTNGTCGPTCTNAGASCADDDGCFDCTDTYCDFIGFPELYDMEGYTYIEKIVLAGQRSVFIPFVVVTLGDMSKITLHTREDPMHGEVFSFETSTSNSSVVVFNMTFTQPLEEGYYDYEITATNEHGQSSNPLTVYVEYREQWCGAWGDPHFTSFDGVSFDFQGNGDYTMVEPAGALGQMPAEYYTFKLQARFSPCWGSTEVTCTSGVSASICNGATTLAYVANTTGAIDGDTESLWYVMLGDTVISVTEEPMNITCPDDSTVAGTLSLDSDGVFKADLRKRVGALFKMAPDDYGLSVLLSSSWVGHTIGLCGIFNGDYLDDLTALNGTFLDPDTATSQQIYELFGTTWHANSTEYTLFNYTYSFFNTSWDATNFAITPVFEPTFDTPEEEEEAERMCGNMQGATQQEIDSCIFDVSVGGPSRAFTAMASVSARCFLETDGSACSSPATCGTWCGLNGVCVQNPDDGSYACQCSPGFVEPLCTPGTASGGGDNSASSSAAQKTSGGGGGDGDDETSAASAVQAIAAATIIVATMAIF